MTAAAPAPRKIAKPRPAQAGVSHPAVEPIRLRGPVYDLQATLKMLNLKSRQAFVQSGLDQHIRSTRIGSVRVYDAEDVDAWALRLIRLRLDQGLGESNHRVPLTQAPEADGRDTECPKCHGFARRSVKTGKMLCTNRHRTHPPV